MARKQLLLVDDDPGTIQVLAGMLGDLGELRFATSGADALRLARELRPDLMLLDLQMPAMSGFEVCRVLRRDRHLTGLPVIVVTAEGDETVEVQALGLGAADFLTKPLLRDQVLARVQAVLRRPPQPLGPGASAALPARQPTILIVDDDATAVHALRNALAATGARLYFAVDGANALILARQVRPDVVMLDLRLPGLDGFEVFEQMQKEPELASAAVLFVTRSADVHNEARALAMGALDFIVKPYTPVVLQARVRNVLRQRELHAVQVQSERERWRRLGDARVADIVAAASDAIVSADAAGEVVLINAAACRLFDTSAQAAVGRPLAALQLPAAALAAHAAPLQRLLLQREGQPPVPVAWSISHTGSGAERLTTVLAHSLETQERAEAAERARLAAEEAHRTKTLMLASVAHEIGNPLNGIIGLAQLMAQDLQHPLADAQRHKLDMMLSAGRQLQALMQDVLNISRVESQRFDVTAASFDALACIRDALDAVSAQARAAAVEIHSELPAAPQLVVGDVVRWQQCLLNLLTNAVKYNRPQGRVLLRLRGDPDWLRIEVQDEGEGLSAAQQAHLFEPFNRLGQRGGTPGFGVGLLVTRNLVQAMGGRILVRSSPGQGSCFTLELPRRAAAAQRPDGAVEPA